MAIILLSQMNELSLGAFEMVAFDVFLHMLNPDGEAGL